MASKNRNTPSTSSASHFGTCSICKDTATSEINSTRCGHVFHSECIGKWLENSTICPVCRTTISQEELIRIYPGTTDKKNVDNVPVDRNSVPVTNTLLTDEELKALTLETFKNQNIVYNQLSLLGDKLAEQTVYIESLKAKLQDKEQKLKFVGDQKDKLETKLLTVSQSHEELQVNMTKMRSEKETLESQLEEVGATMEYMDTLVEQHKADYLESRDTIGKLEDELHTIQQSCGDMENTISKIELIRYEVQSEDDSKRPVEDFVEDLVVENSKLKMDVAETERTITRKEYEVMDLELNVNGLRETLKDIQNSYADQSSESKDMEEALRTMQRLYKEQTEELQSMKGERDQYQHDIKDMLDSLKKSEETSTKVEARRRESDMLNQSYQGQLAESKSRIESLQTEKQDAVMMVGLKEDVIRTLQESIKTTANSYLERLDRFTGDSGSVFSDHIQTSVESGQDADVLAILDARFKALSNEIEKKDDLLIHLMSEKSALEEDKPESVSTQILESELQDKIEMMTDKMKKLESEIRKKEDSVEEKEMVITHLVSVINRYAFNDSGDKETARRKKMSAPPETLESVSIASSEQQSSDQPITDVSPQLSQRTAAPGVQQDLVHGTDDWELIDDSPTTDPGPC